MNRFIQAGRFFYGIGLVVYGALQLYYKDYRPAIAPDWPNWLHLTPLVYLTGIALIAAGVVITGILPLRPEPSKKTCLLVGAFFLALLLFCHIPQILFISENSPHHLGVWAAMLKEVSFCGGAFVMAGSYNIGLEAARKTTLIEKAFNGLIPWGPVFFATNMVLFGFSHFFYNAFIAPLVPHYFGMPSTWTYIAGIALIGGGTCIALRIAKKPVAVLLAIMIFIWFLVIHVPNAISKPTESNGNEIVSAFDALLFCGIALVIAFAPSVPFTTQVGRHSNSFYKSYTSN